MRGGPPRPMLRADARPEGEPMRKTTVPLALLAVLALAAPAGAAKATKYVGKTSSGHKITLTVKKGKIRYLLGGIRISCLPIQGGGRPFAGAEGFGFRSTE